MENETPKPEYKNPIDEIVHSLLEREEQRRKAIDLAFQQVATAENDEDSRIVCNNLVRMLGVQEEFRNSFPEVFPPDENAQ